MVTKVASSAVPWLVAGAGVLLFGALGASDDLIPRSFAVLSLLFGAVVFLTHGGSRITAAGVWCGAFAFFVGFAGLSALSEGGTLRAFPQLPAALGLAYLTQVCMYGLFWRTSLPTEPYRQPVATASVTREAVLWGLVGLTVALTLVVVFDQGTAASSLDESNAGFVATRSLAFSSVAMISVALILGPRQPLISWRWLAIFAALLFYGRFIFSGGGRLTLVALAMCVAIPLSARRSYRWIKALIVIAHHPRPPGVRPHRPSTGGEREPSLRHHRLGPRVGGQPRQELQSPDRLVRGRHAGPRVGNHVRRRRRRAGSPQPLA